MRIKTILRWQELVKTAQSKSDMVGNGATALDSIVTTTTKYHYCYYYYIIIITTIFYYYYY